MLSIRISSEWEDCTITDVESAVPMFVQHTEAMLEEIDRMVLGHSVVKYSLVGFCEHNLNG